ncbi:MAG: (deoxy)nucleoside triphosphate pyrophosphohydrolase [bacterium]
MSDVIQVSAGILVRNPLVLACQRGPGGSHANRWEFPGGKAEVGETAAQCLRRELEEELGIEATIGAEVWRTLHRYPDRAALELTFFRVDEFRGEPVNRIFSDMRWMVVEALVRLDFLDADRELIVRLPELLARRE